MTGRYEIGDILARAADEGELRVRLRSPEMPPRCTGCAFMKGTPANNTLETVLDALGCTIEDVPFMYWYVSFNHEAIGNRVHGYKQSFTQRRIFFKDTTVS